MSSTMSQLDQDAREHDGAGDGRRHPQHQPGSDWPAERDGDGHAQQSGHQALSDGAGHGDGSDGQQVADVEVQPHAEHQQDHADLRELRRQRRIAGEAWGVRPDRHARQQVTDDRREA
jgi:hypothetical protein